MEICREREDSKHEAQMNSRLEEGASRAGILKDGHSSFGSLMVCTRLGFFRELSRVRKKQRRRRDRHSIGLNPVFALANVKDGNAIQPDPRKEEWCWEL
jgi:hypothetical protein